MQSVYYSRPWTMRAICFNRPNVVKLLIQKRFDISGVLRYPRLIHPKYTFGILFDFTLVNFWCQSTVWSTELKMFVFVGLKVCNECLCTVHFIKKPKSFSANYETTRPGRKYDGKTWRSLSTLSIYMRTHSEFTELTNEHSHAPAAEICGRWKIDPDRVV